MCPSDATLLLGHLPAAFVGGTLAVGGLGTLLWGPWKGVKEVSPDPEGRTGNWGVVASSHVPVPQGTSACHHPGPWGMLCPTPPQAHTWFVRSASRSSDTPSLLSSRRTSLCRSSSSVKPFSLKSAKRRKGLRGRGHQPGPHRLLSASATPYRTQLSQVGLSLALTQMRTGLRSRRSSSWAACR